MTRLSTHQTHNPFEPYVILDALHFSNAGGVYTGSWGEDDEPIVIFKEARPYVGLDEKQATGKQSAQTKKEIEAAVSTIVAAFEGILEKLYEEYEMDITSDIAALELSMKQDGLPT
jgi:hypothetical protein